LLQTTAEQKQVPRPEAQPNLMRSELAREQEAERFAELY
jgi:hypothetical protein